jgi:hypothetical protein
MPERWPVSATETRSTSSPAAVEEVDEAQSPARRPHLRCRPVPEAGNRQDGMHLTLTRSASRRIAVVAVAVALASVSACSGSAPPATTTTTLTTTTAPASEPLSAGSPCGRGGSPPPVYDHVVVMVEENRTWTGGDTPAVGTGFDARKMPFLHGLATKCAYFTDWTETDPSQESLSQYIGLTSGVANPATVDDCTPSASCHSNDDNLFRQVRTSGGTARTYVDGATAPCSHGSNAARHIPALYYWGGKDRASCTREVRPLSELDPNSLPSFAFVVPDLCHDGHDCSDSKVDEFARTTLTSILNGSDYRSGRTLVAVVYDEDRPVPNLLIAPTAHQGAISTRAGSHASLLKTIEESLGLPVLHQGQLPKAPSLRTAANI